MSPFLAVYDLCDLQFTTSTGQPQISISVLPHYQPGFKMLAPAAAVGRQNVWLSTGMQSTPLVMPMLQQSSATTATVLLRTIGFFYTSCRFLLSLSFIKADVDASDYSICLMISSSSIIFLWCLSFSRVVLLDNCFMLHVQPIQVWCESGL